MSKESSLELLHEYHEAWERGDQEAGIAFYAEDVLVHMGGVGPLSGTFRGRDAFVNDWIGRVAAATDEWLVLGNDVLLAGDDGVLLMVREEWRRNGRSVKTERLGLYKFSGRQIVECYFSDMRQSEVEDFFADLL